MGLNPTYVPLHFESNLDPNLDINKSGFIPFVIMCLGFYILGEHCWLDFSEKNQNMGLGPT